MIEQIHRLNLWRFGKYEIETFDVVKQTAKTVTVKMPREVGDGFRETFSNERYNLLSQDYAFFDTLVKAERAAVRLISARIEYYEIETGLLKERLQKVCPHIAISSPILGGKCVRCDFVINNSDDYCNGGG